MDIDKDVDEDDGDGNSKEKANTNTKVKAKVLNGRGAAPRKGKNVTGKKVKSEQLSVNCICSRGDDGSPMILCSMCKIWCV